MFSTIKITHLLAACIYSFSIMSFAVAEVYTTPEKNPLVGLNGVASMHGDTQSSDTTPIAGPGISTLDIKRRFFASACPTILVRSDGNPFVLCTSYFGRRPIIRLLDQSDGASLGSLVLKAGNLLGGVYAFLDHKDQLIMVDGEQRLLFVEAVKVTSSPESHRKKWTVQVANSVDLSTFITKHCGGDECDSVVSVGMAGSGVIWFATQNALVGTYDAISGEIHTTKLGPDERIDNSFSTTASGKVAIVTDHTLYVLEHDSDHNPDIVWQANYDYGSARKPGNQARGSGATPSFFGPNSGSEYITITDNADSRISLIVRKTMDGSLVCQHPLFSSHNSGTENSAIAIGNTVVVASTYGYRYPALPEGAGNSIPKSADFVGGMMRVDVGESGDGCKTVWSNNVRSSAVPKLSLADNYIYTIERQKKRGRDAYYFTVLESDTGNVLKQTQIGKGGLSNTIQMAGNVDLDGVYWQGTLSGVSRIEAK